jgi:hypothetical protein
MDVVGDGIAAVSALALVVALTAAQGCAAVSSHSDARPARGATAEVSAETSLERLAGRVLDGLAAGDVAGLSRLVVTRDEFCGRVFSELGSSRVPNVTCDFVWEMADANHLAGFREVLGRHTGKRYRLVSVRVEGGSVAYPSFTVHRDPVVTVRDEAGAEHRYRLFGDVLEREGRFSLFGFMVD